MAKLTTSRGRTYEFSFARQSNGNIRIYILRQPSYGSRDTDPRKIHRLEEDNGSAFICRTGSVRTEKAALDVAKGWAVRTDYYIDTGVWKP